MRDEIKPMQGEIEMNIPAKGGYLHLSQMGAGGGKQGTRLGAR